MTTAVDPGPAIVLLRDFVNTREPQLDSESLTDPDQLARWLTSRSLIDAGAELGPRDLELAISIREGIREVLLSHNGEGHQPSGSDRLDAALAEVPLRLAFDATGPRLMAVRPVAFDRAIAGILDAIRRSAEDHTWNNLKVCARDTCHWAFYDASRNHGRRWCSMAGCGNHIKMKRAYAVRKQRRPESSGT
jgi:predicted RNA-binding Zn ribbon-like protein